ncbi:MAG: FAD:protein FMN transferase, partial [Myxococcota bacterium]
VGQLWSFKRGAQPPTRKAIAEKLPLVDYRKLEIDADAKTVRLAKAGMMLGLGAIAKGYAVDRASAVLTERGLPHHVVEAGGDTYAAGTKGGKPWAVGIQTPGERGVVGVLPSSNRAVVTSGDYQRFFEFEGKRYAHILDPKSGWPVPAERSPRSVTLVADNATDADAYATAVAVMGVEAGLAFVERLPAIEAVVIDSAEKVHISSGLVEEIVQTP